MFQKAVPYLSFISQLQDGPDVFDAKEKYVVNIEW